MSPEDKKWTPGLSKLAFLVSPVPSGGKIDSQKQMEKAKCKTSVFEALDSCP